MIPSRLRDLKEETFLMKKTKRKIQAKIMSSTIIKGLPLFSLLFFILTYFDLYNLSL